jgi:hypothetical protein
MHHHCDPIGGLMAAFVPVTLRKVVLRGIALHFTIHPGSGPALIVADLASGFSTFCFVLLYYTVILLIFSACRVCVHVHKPRIK